MLRGLSAIADRYMYFILVDIFSFIIMQSAILITCQYLNMCCLHVLFYMFTYQLHTDPKWCYRSVYNGVKLC